MVFRTEPMHIPDGFLTVVVAIICWIFAIGVILIALRKVNQQMGEQEVPLMGVLAAAIFTGQMLNFTVIGGTSGHLLGAALATTLVGPWAAVIIMTSVVGLQALVFQDGGLLALGANLLNMAVIAVAVAYALQRAGRAVFGTHRRGVLLGGFVAGWGSTVVTALAVAFQLALSGVSPANVAIPAMGGIHLLIGIGEGLITVGALAFLLAARRDLVQGGTSAGGGRGVWIAGGLITLLLVVISPLASADPDGLESVAHRLNFLNLAQESPFQIIPDYSLPGIADERLATIFAGIIGIGLVLGVAALVRYRQVKRKSTPS